MMAIDPQATVSESITHQQEPLIINGDVEAHARATDKVSYRDLRNKAQLAILCIARLSDPLAASSIQTYMFYQLRFFNPAASEALISTQAGILVGSKTAAQVCTGMLWGRLADSEWGGRKLVLMIGLLCSGLACIGYGFSKSFASAVVWQVFGGAMSSNVGIVRCVVAELNPDKRHRTRALLLLPLFANAGMLLGPLIGGLLSSEKGHGIMKAYPYALPNMFAAVVYAIAAVGVFCGLEETLENLRHTEGNLLKRMWKKIISRDLSMDQAYAALGSDEPESPVKTSPRSEQAPSIPSKRKAKLPFSRIWTWNVICTMVAHFIIAGHIATFTNLWAIFLSTPVQQSETPRSIFRFNGGLGMQPREIGFAMSALGAVGVILQLVIYPMLNDRFGTIKVWRTALYVFPVAYALGPYPSLVGSADIQHGKTILVWLSIGFVLLLFIIGRTGVTPATTLLINDCTPHPSVRGTIHTTGTVIGNLSRSFFPVIAFAIFGKGLEIGVVGLGFWCLACLGLLACAASKWVEQGSNGKEIVLEGDDEPQELNTEVRSPASNGRL